MWVQVLSVLDCYSLSTLLRQGLSLNMGLRFFCLDQKLSNPSNVSVSVLLGAGLTGIHGMSSLGGGGWDLRFSCCAASAFEIVGLFLQSLPKSSSQSSHGSTC